MPINKNILTNGAIISQTIPMLIVVGFSLSFHRVTYDLHIVGSIT